jgi:hypothetical protein
MKLYIANVSRQRQLATYRMDIDDDGIFSERLRGRGAMTESVDRGKQVWVANKDWHEKQVQAIIDQLSVYGIVDADKVPNNLRGPVELVYRRDFPATRSTLEMCLAHNMGVKTEEGAIRREKAAIAAHEALAQKTGEIPAGLDIEFEQEEVSEALESPIAKGFNVMAKPPESVPARKVA